MDKKEEYKESLKDPLWQAKRLEVYEYYGHKCQKCGVILGKSYEVHHPVYRPGRKPWEYAAWELMLLCHDCHYAEHHKEEIAEKILENWMELQSQCETINSLQNNLLWLMAIPVRVSVEPNKFLGVGNMLVKSKNNALKVFDKEKYHYFLIGSIPSGIIECLCRVNVSLEDFPCTIYATNKRVYNGYLWVGREQYEYMSNLRDMIDNDEKIQKEIFEIKNGYSSDDNDLPLKLYDSCIVQSDVELKNIYKKEELTNGTFPHCICLNI